MMFFLHAGRRATGQIKRVPAVRAIPVVIISTSDDPQDVRRRYLAGAARYLVQTMDDEQLVRGIQGLKQYWFDAVVLPS